MHPLRPHGWLLDRQAKLRRDEARKGNASAGGTGLDRLRGRTLDDTRHVTDLTHKMTLPTQAAATWFQSADKRSQVAGIIAGSLGVIGRGGEANEEVLL
jgi:hypothetical protein